jgi:peptidyl-prolyl cis-trans isomerase A (cyclophilin A)
MRFRLLATLLLLCCFFACSPQHPRVMMKTELGDILIELYPEQAPLTTSNFLIYVKDNRYDGAAFYRTVHLQNQPNDSVKIEVIQGGLWVEDEELDYPTIAHETTEQTGILHQDGIISMARLEPGTASSEFFICVGDQPDLDFGGARNPDGQGFAAFGRVVDGMEVVRKIQLQTAEGQALKPRIGIISMQMMDE